MKFIKKFVLMFSLFTTFAIFGGAQSKSITGKVTGYDCTMRGWCSITVQSGQRSYSILLEAGAFAPAEERSDGSYPSSPSVPKTIGNVTKIGRMVQVFYNGGAWEYGDLRATKVIEIKKPKSKSK